MRSRSNSSLVLLIAPAVVVFGLSACGHSPDDGNDGASTHMDAQVSDARPGSGGSEATTGSGGADTDAAPPGSGGAGGAAGSSTSSGGVGTAGTGGTTSVGGADAGSSGTGGTDASTGAGGMDASADGCGDGSCVPEPLATHVHIYISNTCEVSVDPVDVTVPQGQSVFFTYHNHSVDYEADVWMSYGGGYLGLVQGGTWTDPIERCSELFPYTASADVSIHGLGINDPYCPGQRMTIHCE